MLDTSRPYFIFFDDIAASSKAKDKILKYVEAPRSVDPDETALSAITIKGEEDIRRYFRNVVAILVQKYLASKQCPSSILQLCLSSLVDTLLVFKQMRNPEILETVKKTKSIELLYKTFQYHKDLINMEILEALNIPYIDTKSLNKDSSNESSNTS